MEKHPSLKNHWFRVIYSSQPWSIDFIEAVNEYNSTNEYTPVILITLTDNFFNEEVRRVLMDEEATNFVLDSNTRLKFIDHSITKRIDDEINEHEADE